MSDQSESRFVYVIFIRAAPERVWSALTDPDIMTRYWFGMSLRAEWTQGAAWRLAFPDGRIADSGEVVAIDAPHRLVLKWRNEFRPELAAEGYATCAIDVEAAGDATKLTVTHSIALANSKLIEAVSGGWPRILSNLKSLLETGEVALR